MNERATHTRKRAKEKKIRLNYVRIIWDGDLLKKKQIVRRSMYYNSVYA